MLTHLVDVEHSRGAIVRAGHQEQTLSHRVVQCVDGVVHWETLEQGVYFKDGG